MCGTGGSAGLTPTLFLSRKYSTQRRDIVAQNIRSDRRREELETFYTSEHVSDKLCIKMRDVIERAYRKSARYKISSCDEHILTLLERIIIAKDPEKGFSYERQDHNFVNQNFWI